MDIQLANITIGDITAGYEDNGELSQEAEHPTAVSA